jgi:hypothetical protein
MKNISSFSLIIALLFVLFGGCVKKDNPPSLPPSNSMTIDFSDFASGKKSVETDNLSKGINPAAKINWTLAATTAGFWNLLLTVNLAIPVASFKKAIENTPVYLENKKWEWKYSVNFIGVTYNARLTGQIQTSDVKWEMYISKTGIDAFSEFLWFSGTSALDAKSGQWTLNHSQAFPEPLLQIDWKVTGTEIGSIKYTYIRALKDNRTTDLFKTSYIEYGLTTGALNAFYNVHYNNSTTTSDFKDVTIEWSTTNHNGHIKALHYFQDSNWHCWDGTGNDVTCN